MFKKFENKYITYDQTEMAEDKISGIFMNVVQKKFHKMLMSFPTKQPNFSIFLKDFISPTLPFILLVSAMGSCFPVRHIEKGAMRVKEGLKNKIKPTDEEFGIGVICPRD